MSRGNDVDMAVKTMLEEVTGHDVHLLRINGGDGELPYSILYPLTQPTGRGSWADPEEDRDYLYQVTSVGEDNRQVRHLQDLVESGFLRRGVNNGYHFPIAIEGGANVQSRSSDQLGAIVPSGDKLFKSDDIYRVRVGK